ncbi:stage III sporulation protein AG [Neobacillus sp. YX16]|jgi:stage III sporulation protein AG|uniref:stage III sporulation protein AG n=1 Tax=Bacillaceae TaxID=186817 RepID=UPI000BA546D1|nr:MULTISPECIES: stage III sporulation protein AG [Bacillaceae]PAE43940.1 stage III sporulation protein AG [Bacillus sp. 7884-1]TDL77123.1 stage III sporulation protein AG [Rhodococcus qingshengii]WHZ01682.1 stage III sporulation protein AG [Neobacillus sp. YX16]
MENNKGPFSWLKNLVSKGETSDKKSGKYQYMILVLCIGAAFMIVGNVLFSDKSAPLDSKAVTTSQAETSEVEAFSLKKDSNNKTISGYEEEYEKQLKNALEEMLGVDDVMVVVNIDSTDKKVLEKNTVTKSQTTEEKDNEGGERKVQDTSTDEQLVIIREGEKEVPIVVEYQKPAIRGVLVVAKGAENIQVKKWIIEAVTRALDVPSHRVAVMPKK